MGVINMGELKEKLEVFGSLLIEDLQKATMSANLEDIFAARLYAQSKIQEMIESNPTTFTERTNLKQMKLIDGLLQKRYTKIQNRKDQIREKNNKEKKKRAELHKLIDSGLVQSILKDNVKTKALLHKEQLKNNMIDYHHAAMADNQSADLIERAKKLAQEKNISIPDAIRELGKQASSISNEVSKLIDFSVLTETEPLTKANPIKIDFEGLSDGNEKV